jgi:hypothetical protein
MLWAGAKNVIPVATFDWRPKPFKRDAALFGERVMPIREAVPRPVRVRGAAEERARERRHCCEHRLERGDRAGPHAPAACRVECIGAKTLDGGDAQSVNRRLGENEPWTPFCLSSGDSRGVDLPASLSDEGEDLSSKVTLQGSNGVEFGMPFCDPTSNVVLGSLVGP